MKLFGTKYRESKKMESFVRMMTFVRRKKTISMIREAVKKMFFRNKNLNFGQI